MRRDLWCLCTFWKLNMKPQGEGISDKLCMCVCVGGLFINLSLLQNHSGVSSQLHVGTPPSSNQCWLSPGASVSFQVALCAQQISCVTVLNSSGIKFTKQTVCTTCIGPHVACSRHKYWNHQIQLLFSHVKASVFSLAQQDWPEDEKYCA